MKNCKHCKNEINKKAEICPHCGCRVKSNTIKFVVICLIVIFILIGGYLIIKNINQKIIDNNRLKEQQAVEKQKEHIIKNESKLFNSFIGQYKLFYNENVVSSELQNFNFVDKINIDKKCYFNINHTSIEEDDVVENCINAVDFETIDYCLGIHPTMFYVYKIDDENAILSFEFQNIAKTNNSSVLMSNRICFEKENNDKNTLIQTKCTKRKSGHSSFDEMDSIDTKYEFKLVKIK